MKKILYYCDWCGREIIPFRDTLPSTDKIYMHEMETDRFYVETKDCLVCGLHRNESYELCKGCAEKFKNFIKERNNNG